MPQMSIKRVKRKIKKEKLKGEVRDAKKGDLFDLRNFTVGDFVRLMGKWFRESR
jgi:hypothetical protein